MRGWFHGRALGALALCLILASLVTVTGCGFGGSVFPGLRWEKGGGKATEKELATYAQAVEALNAGKYERAASLFNDTFVATQDMELAGRARYGQAVAKLGAARSREDLRQAMDMWAGWSSGWPTSESCPDPRLFDPLLPRMGPAGVKPFLNGKARDMNSLELQAEELARQLDQAQRENEDMRAKIRALEELHQEMQQRQKKLITQ